MHQSSDDRSDSQSEIDSIQGFRPNANLPADYNAEINQTADSIKPNFTNEGDQYYSEVAYKFSQFYEEQLLKSNQVYNKNVDAFLGHKIFEKYKKSMKVYRPIPNLYFLSTKIIIQNKVDSLIPLRDSIVEHFGNRANVQTPKQRPSQILVTIHDQREMSFYVIRFSTDSQKYPHKMPQLLDEDLSINPLFNFYMQYDEDYLKIGQTCGIFMYWAYQRKLLNYDFLTESALKLIVIYFYFSVGYGLPNIITNYFKQKGSQLNKLRTMCKVDKKFQCTLQPELFNSYNFSIKQKRSFYHQSQNKYTTMINILPVPYPVTKQDQQKFVKSTNIVQKSKQLWKDKKIYPVLIFLQMMRFLQNNIKRSQRIVFDFAKDRKGLTQIPDRDFNIEIKHPIFGHNICSNLTNDSSKIRILKEQISNAVKIFNNCRGDQTIEAFSKIFDKKP